MARTRVTLAECGEDRLVGELAKLVPTAGAGIHIGPGDDCAEVDLADTRGRRLLIKTDAVVEGVHFDARLEGHLVGRKALCRALSDFAAAGGVPRWATVNLFSPASRELRFWKEVYRGLGLAARKFGVTVVGGESTTAPLAALSIHLVGFAPRGGSIRRDGGRPGDHLFVTGRLGGSRARKHWAFDPRLAEGRALAESGRVAAMMDLSDGLGVDLPRLAAASGCDYQVEAEAIPRTRGCSLKNAISDGEDYELLFAVRPAKARTLPEWWKGRFPRVPLSRIGRLVPPGEGVRLPASGYQHFVPDSAA